VCGILISVLALVDYFVEYYDYIVATRRHYAMMCKPHISFYSISSTDRTYGLLLSFGLRYCFLICLACVVF
jgi:hypothetical protein